jgi:hypothetical protein
LFLLLKGTAVDTTDAPQPSRLIVQPYEEDNEFFSAFPFSWSTGGLKLTGENRSTRRKTCPSATLSTTNPTGTDPGSNSLSHGTANTDFNVQQYFVHKNNARI